LQYAILPKLKVEAGINSGQNFKNVI